MGPLLPPIVLLVAQLRQHHADEIVDYNNFDEFDEMRCGLWISISISTHCHCAAECRQNRVSTNSFATAMRQHLLLVMMMISIERLRWLISQSSGMSP